MNEENLSINYECSKNRNHYGNNIYYKTFERYYLKESIEKVYKCSTCLSIIISKELYKCKECNKIFCKECYCSEEHINKDNTNIIKIHQNPKKTNLNKKCTKCENNIFYCFDCIQNICIYCSDYHKKHKTINFQALSHSTESIKILQEQITNKSKINENIIISLEEWVKKLKKKVEIIKQKLRDQIDLLKTMVNNYNPFLEEPIYSFNLWNLYNYLKNLNYNDIRKFNGSYGFEEQTKYIAKLILRKEINYENKIGFVYYNSNYINSILHKIDDKNYIFYFPYSNQNNFGLKTIDDEYSIKFDEKVSSISSSKDKKEIYVCLLEEKIVKIFGCDLNLLKLEMKKDKIIGTSLRISDHFNNCIQISNDYFATSDDQQMINIWSRLTNNLGNNKFINISNIFFDSNILDLLSINNEYFISGETSSKISFINISSLQKEKTIIDNRFNFQKPKNCFILLKKYIAVNCELGIAFIYIKTKEIVQFIDNIFENKYLCINNLDSFYIITLFNNDRKEDIYLWDGFSFISDFTNNSLYTWGRIQKFKFIDGGFECIENYKEIYSQNFSGDLKPPLFIFINNRFIFNKNCFFSIEEKTLSEFYRSPLHKQVYRLLLEF